MSFDLRPSAFIFLLALQVFASSAYARNAPKQWEQLSNCQLIPWEYNDGDSFRVRCASSEFVLRLYFIDAPETNLTNGEKVREQRDYFGITLDDVLNAGEKAKNRTRALLQRPFLVWTKWSSAGGRGKEPRYYGLVEVQGKDLGETLTLEGLGRVKGVFITPPSGIASKVYVQKLRDIEVTAQKGKVGAWRSSTK